MFENDEYSKQSMLQKLNVCVLSKFNSMNIQCILPRIDQNLTHTPAVNVLETEPFSSFDSQQNQSQPPTDFNGDKRVAISTNVIKALCHQLLKEEKTKVKEIIACAIG